jgi:hypothetical protein
MKALALLILLLLTSSKIFSQPAEIILIRHAEDPDSDKNVHLSSKGRTRAQALVNFFLHDPRVSQNGAPFVLFAPNPHPGGSVRARETLEPLGRALGRPVATPYFAERFPLLANSIRSNPRYRGKTIVIAWSHEFLPDLAAALGVNPRPAAWNSQTFDRAYVLVRTMNGYKLSNIPQRVLPGDAQK